MIKERTLKQPLSRAAKAFKVILLTGMRQVGKTTLLKSLATPERRYVSLDNHDDLRLAREDPKMFFQLHRPPLIIDEVQYAPELFPCIKMLVDDSDERGRIWMTGSQQFSMMKNVTESLAGRVAIFDLMGLSIDERRGNGAKQTPFVPAPIFQTDKSPADANTIFEWIWRGAFPDALLESPEHWGTFYESYLRSYIERDLRQLTQIGDELAFLRFLRIIAARTAQELNIADIARDAEISHVTAKKWLSILVASNIVILLQPYFKNISKRLAKSPKIYFADTGLCAYLTSWLTPQTLASGAMSGAFFETFVVTEIYKSHLHNGLHPPMYFLRDSNQVEIDLLIERDGKLHPIEIKKTANPTPAMCKNFEKFRAAGIDNLGYGAVVCMTDAIRPLNENAVAFPVWAL